MELIYIKILKQVFCYFGMSKFRKPCQIVKVLTKNVSVEMALTIRSIHDNEQGGLHSFCHADGGLQQCGGAIARSKIVIFTKNNQQ